MQENYYDEKMPYRVGGLLYTPALNSTIGDKIITHKYRSLTAIAFCLEDSITDESLPYAEEQLKKTLVFLKHSNATLPLLFVRVRSVDHLEKIHKLLGDVESILTGYVLPKFDLSNCRLYCEKIRDYNFDRTSPLYIMPILESKAVADIGNRVENLWHIKTYLDEVKDYVLNIRVGGNDFSNMYGLRRTELQNIYEIGVIRDILVNIINVFAADYVISGPVWEYFGEDDSKQWAAGLRKELELDRLNGFIGKTAIHPTQLPIIYDSLKVSKKDYNDALQITNWGADTLGVAKSKDGHRMNEVKCHIRWAKRILICANIYGIREECKKECFDV